MGLKRITIVLVVFCAFSGATVGGAASMPMAVPNAQVAAGGSAAANASTGQVSDCDVVDVDGDNNTVSANITNNATAGDGSVTIQYHCGTNATTLDHDLIDVDGNNNTVTVSVRVENGTLDFGARGSAADSNGLQVGLNCGDGMSNDCDGVDIDGHNNSVTLIVQNDTERTVHEFGANSSNVSWTAGEQNGESGANGGNDSTTDKQGDSENNGSGSADEANRSGNMEDRSNDILGMVIDSIPFVGAATLLVFGSALLVKRNDG